MKPRKAHHTFGAVFLGAALTLTIVAGVVIAGVVHLPGLNASKAKPEAAAAPKSTDIATPATSKSGSLARLYRSVSDGVVYVQSSTDQGTASGSGFLLDTQGDIVTNEHVVEGANSVQVRLGEKGSPTDAQIVGADANSDVAVLKVDSSVVSGAKPLSLGDSKNLQIGQSAVAIGSPFGLQGTLTTGIVSALDRQIQSPSGAPIDGAIQTDAAINPGNSGGPLLDTHGRVIGINAQIASQSGTNSGVGFAIPIDTVKQVVAGIQDGSLGQTDSGSQQQQQQVVPDQQSDPNAPSDGTQQLDPTAPDGSQQVDPTAPDGSQQVDPTAPDAGGAAAPSLGVG